MGFVVPFDGSPLAEAALARAVEFARLLDGTVEAVTVLPDGNVDDARERGWLAADPAWDGGGRSSRPSGRRSAPSPPRWASRS